MFTKFLEKKAVKNLFINENRSNLEAIKVIDKGYRIALVHNSKNKFVGIMTDSDLRRSIINSKNLMSPIKNFVNRNPVILDHESSYEDQIEEMSNSQVDQLIILKNDNFFAMRVRGMGKEMNVEGSVVIMAGGKGLRLRPITKNIPKPLLKVGGKSIIERNIANFKEQKFTDIYLSVNYLKDKIKDQLQDGKKLGVNLNYINERKQMGTIGSLSLIKQKISYPLIVMNSDLIVDIDFRSLIKEHLENKNTMTVCIKEVETEMKYGVIKTKNSVVSEIVEKPKILSTINAGIYIIDKSAVDLIPKDSFYDATMLIDRLTKLNKKVGVHHLEKRWIDIGTKEDLKRARDLKY